MQTQQTNMRSNVEGPLSQSNRNSRNRSKHSSQIARPRRSIAKLERRKKPWREWSCWEKGSYARFLLQFLMSEVKETNIFYQTVAERISRDARQVYAFHCRMLSEFGNIKSIILHILGSKHTHKAVYPSKADLNPIFQTQNEGLVGCVNSEKQVYLEQIQITLNSMEKSCLENLLLAENSPDADEDRYLEFQECGFWDEQQSLYWQQQLNCV